MSAIAIRSVDAYSQPVATFAPIGEAPIVEESPFQSTTWTLYRWGGLAGAILGAYHGYRRNRSIAWAFGWSVFGSILPFFSLPLSVAQGFGRPRGATPNKKRRGRAFDRPGPVFGLGGRRQRKRRHVEQQRRRAEAMHMLRGRRLRDLSRSEQQRMLSLLRWRSP